MQKKLLFLLTTLSLLLVVGCDKIEEEKVEKGRALITNSYTDYITVKFNALSNIYENFDPETQDETMYLLNFNLADYEATPITVCGMDKDIIEDNFASIYTDLKVNIKNDSCNFTYNETDEDGKENDYKVYTKYNELTNTGSIKVYKNKELYLTIEYIGMDGKYVTQYYYEEDKILYKALFSDTYLVLGILNDAEKPKSIYNTHGFFDKEWTKSEEVWLEYTDNKITSLIKENEE